MTSALVTGANRGIGLAVGRALAERGFKVWLGARCTERGLAAESALRADGLDVEFLHLDVADDHSIAAAAARVAERGNGLDILVNNAGIMNEMPGGVLEPLKPSQVPLGKLRELYDTNFFGAVAVIQAFLPLLRGSKAGRIVNVSARFGSFEHQTDEQWPPRAINMLGYGSSKAALNMATLLFAYELRDTPIKINAATPGVIATGLSGISAAELAGKPGYGTPAEGAETIVRYATLPPDGPTAGFFGPNGKLPW